MCSTHWPTLIDLTRDEAKRMLRSLELDAYASVVTALRAQGDLTNEKKKVLQDLQSNLSISLERHKAEVRRAVNDEKLTTIADHMSGSNVSSEWLIEGRRLVPLMPRLVPQTAFTATANTAANSQAEKNASLPTPSQTGKDIYAPPPTSSTTTPTQLKTSGRPQSPPSNVVHLPSGMSIHIKGEIKDEESSSKAAFVGPASDLVIVTRSSAVSQASFPVDGLLSSSSSSPSMAAPLFTVPTTVLAAAGAAGTTPQGGASIAATNNVNSPTTATHNQPMRVTVTKSPVKSQISPLPLGGGTAGGKVVVMSTVGNSNNSNILSTTSGALVTQVTYNPPGHQAVHQSLQQQPHQQSSSLISRSAPAPASSGVRSVTMATTTTNMVSHQIVHSRPYVTTVINSGGMSLASCATAGGGMVTPSTVVSGSTMMASSVSGTSGIEIIKTVPSVAPVPVGMASGGSGTVPHPSPHIITTQRTTAYPRTRTIITRPRLPYPHHTGQRSTIVIPAGSGGTPGGPGVTGIHHQQHHHPAPHMIRTAGPRPAIHIKQEGSMKIITQAVPGSAGSKVITKPTSTGSPVVVISTGSTSVPLATRMSVAGSKILNISSGATRVITASRQSGGNVVTVNPKSFHLTSVKGNPSATALTSTGSKLTTSSGSKPNVIVVQKAGSHAHQKKIMTAVSQQHLGSYSQTGSTPKSSIQVMTPANQTQGPPLTAVSQQHLVPYSQTGSTPKSSIQVMTPANQTQGPPLTAVPRTPPSGAIQSPFEKELVSFIQKQDSQNRQVLSQQQRIERRLAPKAELQHVHHTAKKITVVRQKADGSTTSQPIVITQGHSGQQPVNKSSILAELISAVSHTPHIQKQQTEGDVMLMEEQQAVSSITRQLEPPSATKDSAMVQNQWVEMDAPLGQSAASASSQQPVESSDSSAIKALLDLQQGHRVKVRRESSKSIGGYESVSQSQRGVQMPQSEIITIDQSGNIVQQVIQEGSVDNSNSGGEVQYMQSGQRQIQLKQHGGEFVNEAGQPLRIEVSTEEELAQMENVVSQEIIGELDPNTGILYTTSPIEGQHIISTGEISSITPLSQASIIGEESAIIAQPRVVPRSYDMPEVVTMAAGDGESKVQGIELLERYKQVELEQQAGSEDREDFLTTALDQADIDLDPYQYVETAHNVNQNQPEVIRSRPQEVAGHHRSKPQEVLIRASRADVVHVARPQLEVTLPPGSREGHGSQQPAEVVVHGRRLSFSEGEGPGQEEGVFRVIPPSDGGEGELELEGMADTRNVLHSNQGLVQVVQDIEEPGMHSRIPDVIADVMPSQHASGAGVIPSEQMEMVTEEVHHQHPHQQQTAVVAVEATEGIDPASLHLSDLTSQNIQGEASYSMEEHLLIQQQNELLESPGDGSSQDALSDSLNKRKRKPPSRPDELIIQGQICSWVRMALGLLHKVSKYRGIYKQKGEINAASWFTQPVNPSEVPDYYAIIQTPMDFSTIRRKLETACYRDWSEFHGDMMLIRDNCYQYNVESSEVRTDCDEVFAYYLAEYDKTLQKWQQSQMTSPNSKKPRLDRSPVRPQPL